MKYIVLGNAKSETNVTIAKALAAAGYESKAMRVGSMRLAYKRLGLHGTISNHTQKTGVTHLTADAFEDDTRYDFDFWRDIVKMCDPEMSDVMRTALNATGKKFHPVRSGAKRTAKHTAKRVQQRRSTVCRAH